MNRSIAALTLFVALGSEAAAQGERRPEAGAAMQPRPTIVANSKKPFVGNWFGQMKLAGDNIPIAVDVDFTKDKYTSVSFSPGGKREHISTTFKDGTLRWEIANNGGGVWVYEARRVVGDTIHGIIELRGAGENHVEGILFLVRERR